MCTSWIRCLLLIIAFAFVELELKVIHVIGQKERLWLVRFFFYCIHMKNDTSLANSANGKVTHTLVKITKKLSIGYNVDSDKEKKGS